MQKRSTGAETANGGFPQGAEKNGRSLPWLFVDLDGTLIPPGKEVSRKNVEAVRAYGRAGGKVSIATGRHPLAIAPLIELMEMEEALHITGNGSVAYRKGASRLLFGIVEESPAATRALIDRHVPHIHYTISGLYVLSPDVTREHVELLVSIFHDYQPRWTPPADPETLFKILLFVEEGDHQYDQEMRRLAEVVGLKATRSSEHFLEFISPRSGKGEALAVITEQERWPIGRTVAVGDGENDLSMFRKAGEGVAVANAVPPLLKAATRVVPPCEEDGVATLIEMLLSERP